MSDLAARAAPPELPPPPAARRRRWWRRGRRKDSRRTPDRPCLNCGDPTVGYFCPTCGQKKVDVRVSLRRMLGETLEDELYLNVLLPRTFGALLFRPGHLTAEYVQGRIVRYIQPFRLYLVSSLLLFILLPWLTNLGRLEEEIGRGIAREDSIAAASVDTLATGTVAGRRVTATRSPSFQMDLARRDTASVPPLLRPVNRHALETQERLNRMPPDEALRTLRTAFMENAPTGLFLMMPVFALILKVLYLRRKRYYVEHFVFALHVHAFTYLMIVTMLAVPGARWLNATLSLWLVLYVFFAMKRVYGQGIVKTFFKYLVLGWAYFFVITFGVMVTALLAAMSV